MPLQYSYADGFLKAKITEAVEARAAVRVRQDGIFDYVDANGVTVTEYTETLRIFAAYIIAALENATATDDNYYSKMHEYEGQYEKALARARIAVQSNQRPSTGWGWMNIKLERA